MQRPFVPGISPSREMVVHTGNDRWCTQNSKVLREPVRTLDFNGLGVAEYLCEKPPFAATFAKEPEDIILRLIVIMRLFNYSRRRCDEAIFPMPVFCSSQPHRPNSATPANIVSTMRPAVVVVSAQVSSRDCNPAFFSEITSADTLSTYRRQSPRAPFAHFGTLIPNRTFA